MNYKKFPKILKEAVLEARDKINVNSSEAKPLMEMCRNMKVQSP